VCSAGPADRCLVASDRFSGTVAAMPSIYDLEMTSITGEQVDFGRFRDQVLLIVNVASA
jgi:hypothetical protein